MNSISRKSLIFNFQVIISLIEKSTGKPYTMTYECGPFFFFHVINCYQKPTANTLILDVMAYKNADVIKDLRFCQIEKTDHIPSARAVRLILPLGPQYTTKVLTQWVKITEMSHLKFRAKNCRYLVL